MAGSVPTHPDRRPVAVTAVAALTVILALGAAIHLPWVDTGPVDVYIRWAESVTAEQKADAGARFGLTLRHVREDGVWVVQLADTTPALVRALLQDPRVAGSAYVNEATFEVGRDRRSPIALLFGWLGADEAYERYVESTRRPAALPLLALLVTTSAAFVVAFRRRSAGWLTRGIPDVSPHAVAAFRMAYGLAMFVAVARLEIAPLAGEAQRQIDWVARLDVIRALSASASGASAVQTALLAALALFALGLVPRLALVAAASLLTVFTGIMVTRTSVHDWGLPTVAMWLMTLAPWDQGVGLSWAWRRWRGRPERPPAAPAGLVLWLPGLALGVALLAAAFAKLDTSGLGWITDGAIRYHFLEDAADAPVDWGVRIAASDRAAVLLSFGAIATEALIWLVVFVRGPLARLSFGAAGAALLGGFFLFQGVFWPAWWILLLAFLPWEAAIDRLTRRGATPARRRTGAAAATHPLGRVAVAGIGIFVLQQIVVSTLRIESEPLLSNFPMYAYSWTSREAFDAHLAAQTRRYLLSADGLTAGELDGRLEQVPGALAVIEAAIGRAINRRSPTGAQRRELALVSTRYRALYGEPLGPISVVRQEQRFDWAAGAFDAVPTLTPEGVLDPVSGAWSPAASVATTGSGVSATPVTPSRRQAPRPPRGGMASSATRTSSSPASRGGGRP